MLLPPDFEQLIDQDALVRVVEAIVDHIDRELIDGLYPGGGAPAYDPVMMLKLVMYRYASGIYSSRQIAQATKRHISPTNTTKKPTRTKAKGPGSPHRPKPPPPQQKTKDGWKPQHASSHPKQY